MIRLRVAFATIAAALLLAPGAMSPAPADATFRGSNGRIAFTTNRTGNFEIFAMNADGSGQTNLTNNICLDAQPAWSPDGSTIAFNSDRELCGAGLDLYVTSASGAAVTKVTDIGRLPSWAPDGSRLAYICEDGDLCVVGSDGSNKAVLYSDTAILGRPAWSPDGSTIAFDRSIGGLGIQEIVAIDANGTNARTLTSPNGAWEPNWSPDGTRIAYSAYDAGGKDRQIFIMPAAGETAGRTQVTSTTGFNAVGDRIRNETPVWSPDALEIAFVTNRDIDSEVYSMKADGSLQIPLTASPYVDWSPDWQAVAATAGAAHDVAVAGGGFHADARITLSREGVGPFPVKIKVKNLGSVSEDIRYTVSSTEPVTLSSGCTGTVPAVAPRGAVIVASCTVTYVDAADPDPTLTLTVSPGAGSTDTDPSNNTRQEAITIIP
jgi:TolB protein